MADAIVSLGVEKLWDLLSKEIELLGGVEEQVNELKSDLNMLMCFLKDADEKKQTSALVRNCLEEIKEIAFDAEDMIEAFQLKEESGSESGIVKHTRRFTCIMVDRRKIALDITSITKRITKVIQVMQTFGLQPIINDIAYVERQRETRHTFSSEPESDHEGLHASVEKLVRYLVVEDNVQVISITGMGGLGKTTLARHVFNHDKVREHFKAFAWVCVSQQFTRQDVWQRILQRFKPEYEGKQMKEDTLQKELSDLLKTQGALIVLDDMWKEEDWDEIKHAFPEEKGWKILLTSRNAGVGLHVSKTCVTFKPKCLTPEESWRLFQRIAFPINDTNADDADMKLMKEMGEKMIECCGGLPLAIKVLGGLLATLDTLREWKRAFDYITTNKAGRTTFNEDSNNLVYQVLSLSFEELPLYLKHCFLYLAHFPEDSAIDVDKLSYYWAAEGMRTPRLYDGGTIRDVADCYIKELVKRNMVIAEKDIKTSRFETCQLHDTMRELCLLKAKEENFLRIVNARTCSSTRHSKSRRHVVHWTEKFAGDGEIHNPKLRSLLFVQEVKFPGLVVSKLSFTRLQLLRILDLSNFMGWKNRAGFKGWRNRAGFKGWKIPSSIGKLIHLRYLSLYKAALTHLPSWLRNLKLLLYLNLDITLITIISGPNKNMEQPISVPNIFKEMQELRYLSLPRYIHEKSKLELGKLVNLETLEHFQTKNSSVSDLQGMKKLRNLSIYVNRGFSLSTLSSPLGSLEHLETLTIDDYWVGLETQSLPLGLWRHLKDLSLYATRDQDQMGGSEEFVLDCAYLNQLNLSIHMPSLPNRQPFPSHLTSVSLSHCCLVEDPMPILEKVLHLNEVSLGAQAFAGKKMVCSRNGFPRLQKLLISGLEEWEKWIVEEDSMPLLHTLHISYCRKLKELPDRLRFITSLEQLRLSVMDRDFKEKLEKQVKDFASGDDKIRRIPIVEISLVEMMNANNNRQPGENLLKRMYSQICGPRSRSAFIAR